MSAASRDAAVVSCVGVPLHNVHKIAALLFGSGMCALTYQLVWTRELRLIFGASTPASSAVLAIFMAGLGAGGVLFGRRVEAHERPLALYARLELLIAGTTALTPLLLALARRLYMALGGTAVLGLLGSTQLRLFLAAIVLGAPALLMGGTLPAAVRAVEESRDNSRRHLATLYGLNTLGAVAGTLLCTFVLLEHCGQRLTLWLACAVNVAVALIARALARHDDFTPREFDEELEAAPALEPLPAARFVLIAAAATGFIFLQMELVWYRMLGPILGGSTFTFGLILAVALLGIGLGGAAYALRDARDTPTLGGFAWLCLVQALLLIAPFALGDRVALFALLVQPLGALGFHGLLFGWSLVACVVILPAAFIAGWQFPLLIALLGRGSREVGRQVGLAYAWNTAGSIAGSLAGGFGLLPMISAPGAWRLCAALLCALGISAWLLSLRGTGRRLLIIAPPGLAILVAILITTSGPSAVWRHSGIGVGRSNLQSFSPNALRAYTNTRNRSITWQRDGVESSVALSVNDTGQAFVVNGKVDGSARGDAATQVVSGLVGAILHGRPERVLVIGLGTGSTAGWLAEIPSVRRVDVAEIEPSILEVARRCAAVNRDVLHNPKVHVFLGDGRELLLGSHERYDLIVSEPSNPYRAGIASMYTQDFYRGVQSKLSPGGLFVQWMQSYEVDNQTVRTVYATLSAVFSEVETWLTQPSDLLLVGAQQPLRYDALVLRQRLREEPYHSALARVFRVTNLEGFLAHFVARDSLARALAKGHQGPINTDDKTPVEFGYARSVNASGFEFSLDELRQLSHERKEDLPIVNGALDLQLLDAQRVALYTANFEAPHVFPFYSDDQKQRAAAHQLFLEGDLATALELFQGQPREPSDLVERALLAEGLAEKGDAAAQSHLEKLRAELPAEADAIAARLALRTGDVCGAAQKLDAALRAYQQDAWPSYKTMARALELVMEISARSPALAARFATLLQQPFAVGMLEQTRQNTRRALTDLGVPCLDIAQSQEPLVQWQRDVLLWRLACYRSSASPHATKAAADYIEFMRAEPSPLRAQTATAVIDLDAALRGRTVPTTAAAAVADCEVTKWIPK